MDTSRRTKRVTGPGVTRLSVKEDRRLRKAPGTVLCRVAPWAKFAGDRPRFCLFNSSALCFVHRVVIDPPVSPPRPGSCWRAVTSGHGYSLPNPRAETLVLSSLKTIRPRLVRDDFVGAGGIGERNQSWPIRGVRLTGIGPSWLTAPAAAPDDVRMLAYLTFVTGWSGWAGLGTSRRP